SLLPQPLPGAAETARVHRFPQSASCVSAGPSTPRRAQRPSVRPTCRPRVVLTTRARIPSESTLHQEEEVPDAQTHDSFDAAGRHARLLPARLRGGAAGFECSRDRAACAAAAAHPVRPARTDGVAANQRAPADAAELPAG